MPGDPTESGEQQALAGPPSAFKPSDVSIDAFVSYASHDAPVANSIVEALEKPGLRCWIAPRDVTPGSHYADHIMSAISRAKVLVLVLSDSALASKHVGKEVERASSKGRPIIALRTDAAALTPAFEYFLSESQWIDVGAGGVAAVAAKLVEAVRSHAGSAVSAGPVARPAAPSHLERPRLRRWGILGVAGVFAVVFGYLVVDKFWLSRPVTGEQTTVVATGAPATTPVVPATSEKSIAVLPFADLSEKKDQEYFADGMTEEIINLLTKVPDLRVPARTSSFYFRGKSTKVSDIARELGVAHILEGSIRRSGNRIRVTAQLVRADNGYDLWSQTYDRDLHDVFKVQDDIANAVVQALQISLMGGPLTRQKGGTQNLEAYLLYLRSTKENDAFSATAIKEARKHIEQAIKLDPDFLLARTMLGWVNVNLAQLRELPVRDGYERARQLAQNALELSPDLADAHLVLGYIHRNYDWDWVAAQSEARQGLTLDPTHRYALELNGQVAASIGDWDGAERYFRHQLANDPLNPQPHWDLGTTLYRAGRFTAAETEYRKLIELVPDYAWARGYLAKTLLAQGKPEAALAMAQQEGDEANRLDILPIFLQAAGRHAEADEALKALATKYADSDAYFVAMNYAYRDDHDLALQWLERAYQQKESGFIEIVGEPLFKNLANDARYKAFLRKMNLPQ
jgi:TolB-like protein/Tfp pilus assembly protein PilF